MKHLKPFRSVFDSTRYVGALIYTAKGWDAHNPDGQRVGTFEDDAKAVAFLRRGPGRTRITRLSTAVSTGRLRSYFGHFDGAQQST